MKLEHKRGTGILSEYIGEFTTELDKLAKLNPSNKRFSLYHYVMIDEHSVKDKCLAVRVHGGTVGSIKFDDNNVITKIFIDRNYIIKSYPEDINELMNKYVGERIEW